MKNIIKYFKMQGFKLCAVAVILAIGFSFASCASGADNASVKYSGTIEKVAISPNNTVIVKGDYWVLRAVVTGTEKPSQTVTWSIEEDNKASGTAIDSSGKLTIASDETLSSITIKAVSILDKEKSATTTVKIIDNPAFSEKQPFNDITATQLVAGITIGWNLGNTLDSGANMYNTLTALQLETRWIGVIRATTQKTIDTLKEAGFNAIRIPVTWHKAMDKDYHIRSDFMARVTEIVNYAVASDMYILLNTHHDEEIFKYMSASKEASFKAFETVWRQIAENFKNYNEKLVFEALNEPRTIGLSTEWMGGTLLERMILNEHYQLFVDTVRKTGGNNDKRILMVNTYAASTNMLAVNGLVIPKDTVPDKIIASVHAYAPFNFAQNGRDGSTARWDETNVNQTAAVNYVFNVTHGKFIVNGIPVIIGEFGALDRNNEEARAAWAKYYVSQARYRGIKCFLWDNNVSDPNGELYGFFERRDNTFRFPLYLQGLMEGAGVR
uniref:Glycoside hydrolase family 5 n=1 Tax=uncultured bacterium contig00133 TaxID=1181582 RepID=A0A806JYB8_9BACT|nr:glycoside hydrolase family 5 [uncultured bacterium contig00133]